MVELTAIVTGRVRNSARDRSELPGVGDFVGVRPSRGDGPATIEIVLPRTTALIRKASGEERPQLLVSNVDVALVVTAADADFNLARIERYLALVQESGARPVVIVNKSDLRSDASDLTNRIVEIAPAVPVHALSARDHACARDIEIYFKDNQTVVMIGSSGVGKSTLTNRLLGRDVQATREVRAHDGRGRHTTTHRQLFLRPAGGALIDTPGLRGLELWKPPAGTGSEFDDLEALALKCKFRDCHHDREPGCAVRAAVERGDLDVQRAESFTKAMTSSRAAGRGGRH
jgi:ribosome biogenesis GTPase